MTALASAARWLAGRYRAILLRRALGRTFEIMRYALIRSPLTTRFHIVSSERGAGEFAIRCLESVDRQRYPRELVRHVFIDDASPDDTPGIVERWLKDHPLNRVEFIRNLHRRRAFENNLVGFRMARPGDVVLELNGDDWLPDPGVLRFFDKVYSDTDVWITFNTLRQVDGTLTIAAGPSRRVIEEGGIRSSRWCTSHLHTFRYELFELIGDEAFRNPKTGNYWETAHDQATYLYNFHSMSDEMVDSSGQRAAAAAIRELPVHEPVENLDGLRS
jgi:glycosyltransferase involved in cell wall biosynthesis